MGLASSWRPQESMGHRFTCYVLGYQPFRCIGVLTVVVNTDGQKKKLTYVPWSLQVVCSVAQGRWPQRGEPYRHIRSRSRYLCR